MPNALYTLLRPATPVKPLPHGLYIELGSGEIVYTDRWNGTSPISSWVIIDQIKNIRVFPWMLAKWDYGGGPWYAFGGWQIEIPNCKYVTTTCSASNDFDGESNTAAILECFGDVEPSQDSSIYPAKVCANQPFLYSGTPSGYMGGGVNITI